MLIKNPEKWVSEGSKTFYDFLRLAHYPVQQRATNLCLKVTLLCENIVENWELKIQNLEFRYDCWSFRKYFRINVSRGSLGTDVLMLSHVMSDLAPTNTYFLLRCLNIILTMSLWPRVSDSSLKFRFSKAWFHSDLRNRKSI